MSSMVPGEQPSEEVDELVAGLDLDGPPDGPDAPGVAGGLLDQIPPPGLLEGEQESWELSGWSGASRTHLESLLAAEDVPHLWQGARLTAPAADAEVVAELIEDVEQTAEPALGGEGPRLVYAVGTWPALLQSSLAESLGVAGVPYEWDEAGDLVVYEEDEEQVDEILDGMPDPPEEEAPDGLDPQQVLSALFVAARRLARHPRDTDGVLGTSEGADRLEAMPVPFGFEPPVWRSLVEQAVELRDGLQAPVADGVPAWTDEEVAAAAAELRDQLRRVV